MNILIPMAGEGKRFIISGFDVPKPLIDVLGKPMIQWAVDTLGLHGKKIFIIRSQHKKYGLHQVLKDKYNDCEIIDIDYVTEGAVCTCLLAKRFIDNDEDLVIANCDQIMEWDADKFLSFVESSTYDGVVVTYYANTPLNSYVKLNDDGIATQFKEKEVISNESLNGIHYWKKGSDFVYSAEKMIELDERANNEFYIAPTYNYLVEDGKKICAYHINVSDHNAIGTPCDLYNFVNRRLVYEDF